MSNLWAVSDPHFFHLNMLRFTQADGSRVRPEFPLPPSKEACKSDPAIAAMAKAAVDEMNETMVERHNAVVRNGDKVYWLGDITFDYGPAFDILMSRLKGHKRLQVGNHDKLKGTNLLKHFGQVSTCRVFGQEGFFFSHIPLRRSSFFGRCRLQGHGHIHRDIVKIPNSDQPDPDYLNLSVEMTNYTPVHFDEIMSKIPG